ncbi:MAG: hypothetical protein ACJ73V_14715 [Acidimicrobiia bacterium]
MRRLAVAAATVGLACGGIGVLSTVAQAAPPSVTVGCTGGVGDSNGLVTAINNANGGGPKTIVLGAGCTYTLTSPAEADNGLPIITRSITLNGSGSTITRDGSAPQFRIVEIGSAGTLTASNVTVSAGHAPDGTAGTAGTAGTERAGSASP